MGRADEAIGHLREALRIDPRSVAAHIDLGLALHDNGRREEAIDHYQQALGIDARSVAAHIDLGVALYHQGRLEEAIDHYQQALGIDPESVGAHLGLGGVLREKGRLEEAIDHYQQALRIDSRSVEAHNNLGGVLREKGRLEEAIGHFQQALRIEPKSAFASAWLGITLYPAARAAVRGVTGPGPENGQPGAPERAGLRRQALDWLRAHLELTTKLANDGKVVDWSLATWQTDPGLANVRDPAALAKLPDAEREQWQRLWADVAALVATDPLQQGRARAARRDWAQAAECYARALMRGPTDNGHFWFEYAAVSLLSGDRAGYARACAHMVERCDKAGGPRAYHVARACTLAPDAVADGSLPDGLAATELRANARQFWSLTEQGALAYRAGRYQEGVPLFEQSLLVDPTPGRAVLNWLWLALANQRLGKAEEARRWLGKAQAWLDQYGDGMPARADEFGLHRHNWLEAHILRREAEAMIQSTGPGR
jgi:tetratricopeptide (TPR) repeat protein